MHISSAQLQSGCFVPEQFPLLQVCPTQVLEEQLQSGPEFPGGFDPEPEFEPELDPEFPGLDVWLELVFAFGFDFGFEELT